MLPARLEAEIRATPCPFRSLSTYTGLIVQSHDQLPASRRALADFCSDRAQHNTTSFLLGVEPAVYGGKLAHFAALLERTLIPIIDSPGGRSWSATDWRLRIGGVDFFALALLPDLPSRHPRRSLAMGVLLIQPESLFDAVGITTNGARPHYTATARKAFERAQRDFVSSHEKHVPKQYRLLLDERYRPVPWWRGGSSGQGRPKAS